LSSAEQKFHLKVRRASGITSQKANMTNLRGLIKYPPPRLWPHPRSVLRTDAVQSQGRSASIDQDIGHRPLKKSVDQAILARQEGEIAIRAQERRDLDHYLEKHGSLDVPHIVLRLALEPSQRRQQACTNSNDCTLEKTGTWRWTLLERLMWNRTFGNTLTHRLLAHKRQLNGWTPGIWTCTTFSNICRTSKHPGRTRSQSLNI
jgi:hypothetical protein